LAVAEYAAQAAKADQFRNKPDALLKVGYGLFGEIGGLLSALKAVSRDASLEMTETDFAGEEIGDAMWYLVSVAAHAEVDAGAVSAACLRSLREQFGEVAVAPTPGVTFDEIDGLVEVHRRSLHSQRESLLRSLAAAVGNLTEKSQADLQHADAAAKADELGRIMAKLAMVAGHFRLGLSQIARHNLAKIKDRWPGPDPVYPELPDKDALAHEQLPRQFDVVFLDRKVGRRNVVIQQMKGVNIGDPLTDNSYKPDGYRYHDVFHLSYVAHLGWSPVIRALLKLKRKSDPKKDENDDGARAIIIEEGIATWIFNDAKPRKFFADVVEGRLDYRLLKQVHSMVRGYEPERCPLWQWERAILDGFKVFRQLLDNKTGTVSVDMEAHTLTFDPATPP
jgi:NTP pyrophosphatase (non-canonical NTP hydrolase)